MLRLGFGLGSGFWFWFGFGLGLALARPRKTGLRWQHAMVVERASTPPTPAARRGEVRRKDGGVCDGEGWSNVTWRGDAVRRRGEARRGRRGEAWRGQQ